MADVFTDVRLPGEAADDPEVGEDVTPEQLLERIARAGAGLPPLLPRLWVSPHAAVALDEADAKGGVEATFFSPEGEKGAEMRCMQFNLLAQGLSAGSGGAPFSEDLHGNPAKASDFGGFDIPPETRDTGGPAHLDFDGVRRWRLLEEVGSSSAA